MTTATPLNLDKTFHLVICNSRTGAYAAERDLCDLDRATTVKDIAEGQFGGDIAAIIEFNPVEGTSRDATEDIASAVMTRWAGNGEPLSDWKLNFVESHIGIQAALSFRRAA